jgi:hypothetical protein
VKPVSCLPIVVGSSVLWLHSSAVLFAHATADDLPICPVSRVSSRSVSTLTTSKEPVEPTSASAKSSSLLSSSSSSTSVDARLDLEGASSFSFADTGFGVWNV